MYENVPKLRLESLLHIRSTGREIFSCDGNTSGTPRVLIGMHTYPTICLVTCGVLSCVPVTLKNLSYWKT
ncbi:hypothetical protein DVH24_037283 [Malus domestica]|uniref:Uncharacterized protein n=1 Tax=Malus domestica TaxID=3750 RepID=A0A498HER2_MALDO|nr:hypothetical protein DVH24_037283 [Malus domestica]